MKSHDFRFKMREILLLLFSGIIAFAGRAVTASCTNDTFVMRPDSVVVRHGDPVSVNCSVEAPGVRGMGWEATDGDTGFTVGATTVTWTLDALTDWTIKPLCYVTFSDGQCSERLPVTVYKVPDSVSLSVSPAGPMVEGRAYHLQCAVVQVAPVHSLEVSWFSGDHILQTQAGYNLSHTPVDVTPDLVMVAHRDDHGAQILCETHLNLGPAGPNPFPTMSSEPHHLIVYYPPTFSSPEEEVLDVGAGEDVTLNCSASGNPAPTYSLGSDTLDQVEVQSVHTAQLPPGVYNCTASNAAGTSTKTFTIREATRSRSTFWAIIGAFVGLALLLLVGYTVFSVQRAESSVF